MSDGIPGEGAAAYRLRVELDVDGPPVWRRVVESPEAHVPQLHRTFQGVFEWEGRHRWAVESGGRRIERSREHPSSGAGSGEQAEATLAELVEGEGDTLGYVYDLGQRWVHTATVEAVLEERPHRVLPVCEGGAGAGPLEDSRGVGEHGYLAAHADPGHFDVDRADAFLARERHARAGPFARDPPPTVDELVERAREMGLSGEELEDMRADLEEQARRWTG